MMLANNEYFLLNLSQNFYNISNRLSTLLNVYQHALSMEDRNLAQRYDYCVANCIQAGLCMSLGEDPALKKLLLIYSVVVLRKNVAIYEYFWPTPADRVRTGIGFNETLIPRIECLKWMINYYDSNYSQKLLIHIKYKLYKKFIK